jgi:hypothetical protein
VFGHGDTEAQRFRDLVDGSRLRPAWPAAPGTVEWRNTRAVETAWLLAFSLLDGPGLPFRGSREPLLQNFSVSL